MGHGFFEILFSRQHLSSPFSCSFENEEIPNVYHSLNTLQKVTTFVVAIFVGLATAGLGIIPAFYIVSAGFKARNSVWIVYQRDCPDRYDTVFFNPNWWGIPHQYDVVPRRAGYNGDFHVPVGVDAHRRNQVGVNQPYTPERIVFNGDRGHPARHVQPGGQHYNHVPVGRR